MLTPLLRCQARVINARQIIIFNDWAEAATPAIFLQDVFSAVGRGEGGRQKRSSQKPVEQYLPSSILMHETNSICIIIVTLTSHCYRIMLLLQLFVYALNNIFCSFSVFVFSPFALNSTLSNKWKFT